MTNEEAIHHRYTQLAPVLDERQRRLWASAEALTAGPHGVQCVAGATGLSHHTVRAGCQELQQRAAAPPPPPKGKWGGARTKGVSVPPARARIRAPGAGRKPLTQTHPQLLPDLDALIEPATRGDPESPLRWCCKSTRQLAAALQAKGHPISYQKVAELLRAQGYTLQRTRKTREGASHPDRDAQFRQI
ncbi:MAG: ISAzo13 family transposase, partial [Armatimonadetes bacterium]|nr:ISAzo13 family transposase [Armatimonadota bacterium]